VPLKIALPFSSTLPSTQYALITNWNVTWVKGTIPLADVPEADVPMIDRLPDTLTCDWLLAPLIPLDGEDQQRHMVGVSHFICAMDVYQSAKLVMANHLVLEEIQSANETLCSNSTHAVCCLPWISIFEIRPKTLPGADSLECYSTA